MSSSLEHNSARRSRTKAPEINDRGPLALGFDVGGTKTKVGLVTQGGTVLALREFPTGVGTHIPDRFIKTLVQEIQALLDTAKGNVVGIGITFLGWVNAAGTGPFFCMNAPALHNFNFKELIENTFHLPVTVRDDVSAHTLAEYRYGSGRGSRRFLCLAMGTGLGAGIIVGGKSLQYTWGTAGDTGHIILRPGGPVCASGCHGCGEALIGLAGIKRLATEKYNWAKPVHELIHGAAQGDDPIGVAVMKEIGGYTGELLASLFPVFIPERIALTGGTAQAGAVLLEAAKRRFNDLAGDYCRTFSRVVGRDFTGVEILLGTVKGETGVIGAVADFFHA
jgi:glucokinase